MVNELVLLALAASDFGLPNVTANNDALKNVLTAVFIVVGAMAVLFLILASIRYVTANGEPGEVQKAKNAILYAIVGIVLSLLAIPIVQFTAGSIQ